MAEKNGGEKRPASDDGESEGDPHSSLNHHTSSFGAHPNLAHLGKQQSVEIDDSLYSRQRYVLGDEAMKQMHRASVLILGLGGLGVEIAKNLILGGVRKVSLWDNQVSKWTDLASNFYVTEQDVKNDVRRVDACVGKLRELNPGVTVEVYSEDLAPTVINDIPNHFNCVVVTEIPLSIRIALNQQLRSRHVPFITGDAFGIFAGVFCDFGENFLVHDPRAEEGRELLIGSISQTERGEVTCLEGYRHGLEAGDLVEFKDISGMTELNGQTYSVEKVITPMTFCIGDTRRFTPHDHGGMLKQVAKPRNMSFESLDQSMMKPNLFDCDFSRPAAAGEAHLAWMALMKFQELHSRLPRSGDASEFAGVMKILQALKSELNLEGDVKFFTAAFRACEGQLNPLTATMGGVIAQEAMKALTGKFTPLHGWLYLDARDVYSEDSSPVRNDRYDGIRLCIGNELLEQLKNIRSFMVGCGAIGCEMLKNLALIGVGCGTHGQVEITDDDHIEKSNLNRQFLFRPEHIGQSKSQVGARKIHEINPDVHVLPHQLRVSPLTQATPFSDEFYQKTDIVINALDNVQARMYMDQRCVTNCKPLLDSGTLGSKGHVQVVIPYLSESYGTQRDPVENPADSIPFCTLKQFPALMEHCIEWAREKFQSSFAVKPDTFNNFWQLHGPSAGQLLQKLHDGAHMEGVPLVFKLISRRPRGFPDTVALARSKFEKYFSSKANQLLHMFPLDHTVEGGVKFWTSPKRPPVPVKFDAENPLHLAFLRASAQLYAKNYGIPFSAADVAPENLKEIVKHVKIPKFQPKGGIEIKETRPTTHSSLLHSAEESSQLEEFLRVSLEKGDCSKDATMTMHPEVFEKDDDSNAHIDFIYAAANLRAQMYRIDQTSRTHVKRIAGRIVPAIATTTACVSGLATLEIIKLVQDLPNMKHDKRHLLTAQTLERYKNTFLNLALPVIYFSEPGAVAKVTLPGGLTTTLWDQWSIAGDHSFTMQNFVDAVKEKYKLSVNSILLGSKMVYMPFMPEHRKRLPQPFTQYLEPLPASENYVDLSVDMEPDEAGDGAMDDDVNNDVLWPPVRYYFR